jgi:predicted Zn-dependent protease
MLAQAMLASGNKALRKAAITHLRRALLTENDNPDPYRLLARIYGQSGQIALAQLNSAERFLREGNRSLAFTQAARARKKLRKGSPAWLRASDILHLKKLNSRRKR